MYKLLLPRLGQTMEEGTIGRWLVDPGAEFQVGDHLYEVETEKVTIEVEATLPGTIVRVLVEPESSVEVGTLLAVVAAPGEQPAPEEIDAFLGSDALEAPAAPAAPATPAESAFPAQSAAPAAPAPVPAPTSGWAAAAGPVLAMPRTRELARQHGMDLSTVEPTGEDGLITEQDVRAVIDAAAAPSAPSPSATSAERAPLPTGVAIRERRRLGGVGRTMAHVTTRSWREVPAFSQSVMVRAPGWRAARDRLRAETGLPIGYTDLALDSLVRAATEVPEVNSSFDGDALVLWQAVNVSIAVDTDAGLLVPVLHGADSLDIAGRHRALVALVERARSGGLGADDVAGGTITLSNLGMYGIEGGFPMVTAPQASIAFIGAMRDTVVAQDGAIAVMPAFSVTTAFDHRALDGATAARFTSRLKQELEAWR